jgi:predicted transcriptional regulator
MSSQQVNVKYLADIAAILESCKWRVVKRSSLFEQLITKLHRPGRFYEYLNELVDAGLLKEPSLSHFKITPEGLHRLYKIRSVLTLAQEAQQ